MLKRVVSFLFVVLTALPIFSSCGQKEKQVFETFSYFDTYSTVTAYGTKEETAPYFEESEKILKKYHELLDIYNSYDNAINLKSVNDNAGKGALTISKELFDVIKFGIEMHEKTNGSLNIAIGSVSSIWHDVREKASDSPSSIELPSQDIINEALTHTDISSIILDADKLSINITDPSLKLDLGGIAKGYVATILYDRLIALGCESFLINLGGNVVSCGEKPDGTKWSAAIENPFNIDSLGYNKAVILDNSTLVTSGSYQRYFIFEGKSYSHIIDTNSGYPAQLFTSVSIKASSSMSGLADALSTALFCMSFEEGLALITSIDGVEALWIFNDGSYKTSPGFGGAE